MPGWRVTMVQVNREDPTGGVPSGRTDVAFVRLPMFDDAVIPTLLLTEPHQLAIPVDHKFADRDFIEFDELNWGAIRRYHRGIGCMAGLVADEPSAGGGAEAIIGAEVETPDEWFGAISTGAGVAITPRSTAVYYTRPGIAFRALNGVPPSTAGIIRRRGDRRRIVDDFVSAAAECAEVGFDMQGDGSSPGYRRSRPRCRCLPWMRVGYLWSPGWRNLVGHPRARNVRVRNGN